MRAGKSFLAVLIAVGASCTISVLATFGDSPVAHLSSFAFDRYQRLLPRPPGESRVVLVDIDERSLREIGQWPWPRTRLAQLIAAIDGAGTTAIGLDIILAEPDRTSPRELGPMLEADGAPRADVARMMAALPDHDARLARAISQSRVVAGIMLDNDTGSAAPVLKAGYAVAGASAFREVPRFDRAIVNLPEIGLAAAGVGFLNAIPDRDGIVRRASLVLRVGDTPVPSLIAEMARVATGAKTYLARAESPLGDFAAPYVGGLEALKIGPLTVPTMRDGAIWIYYGDPGRVLRLSASDVMAGRFDPTAFHGHMAIIGSTAVGLKDYKPTPVSPSMAGAEIHIQALEQILDGTYLSRPDWLIGAQTVGIVLLAVAVALIGANLGVWWSAPSSFLAMGGCFAVSWFAFSSFHLLIDPVVPVESLTLTFSGVSLMRRIQAERGQRRLRRAFSRYLAPVLVEQLAAHPEKLSLGGEMRPVTVMFCDIRDFSGLAEGLDPRMLTSMLNDFLSPMSDIVLAHRGTIDKYIGDCIMAFWNAPLDDANHDRNAVAAAQDMRQALDGVNRALRAKWPETGREFKPLRMAIGLNSGECCVGNMGSRHRFDYSILGDAVNIAARLAELAAARDLDLAIGEATAAALPPDCLTLVDQVQVRGRVQPVKVFTIAADKASLLAADSPVPIAAGPRPE